MLVTQPGTMAQAPWGAWFQLSAGRRGAQGACYVPARDTRDYRANGRSGSPTVLLARGAWTCEAGLQEAGCRTRNLGIGREVGRS